MGNQHQLLTLAYADLVNNWGIKNRYYENGCSIVTSAQKFLMESAIVFPKKPSEGFPIN